MPTELYSTATEHAQGKKKSGLERLMHHASPHIETRQYSVLSAVRSVSSTAPANRPSACPGLPTIIDSRVCVGPTLVNR